MKSTNACFFLTLLCLFLRLLHSSHAQNLTVLARHAPPMVFIDDSDPSNIQFDGISIWMLGNLSERLNLSLQILPRSGSFGDFAAELSLNDSIADAALDWITITGSRLDSVRFSASYYDLGVLFITQRETVPEWTWTEFTFLRPFTADVWVLILCVGVILALLFTVYSWETPRFRASEKDRKRKVFFFAVDRYIQHFIFSLALIVGSVAFTPELPSVYILTLAGVIFSLFMTTAFTANLVTYLTYSSHGQLLFNGLEMLKTNVALLRNIVILSDSSIHDYFMEMFGDASLWQSCAEIEECVESVVKGTALATVLDAPVAKYFVEKYCGHLALRGDAFFLQNYGFAFGMDVDESVVKQFDTEIYQLRDDGVIDNADARFLPVSECGTDEVSDQVQLYQLSGLYLIVLLVTAFVAVAALCTWMWRMYRAQQNRTGGRTLLPETTRESEMRANVRRTHETARRMMELSANAEARKRTVELVQYLNQFLASSSNRVVFHVSGTCSRLAESCSAVIPFVIADQCSAEIRNLSMEICSKRHHSVTTEDNKFWLDSSGKVIIGDYRVPMINTLRTCSYLSFKVKQNCGWTDACDGDVRYCVFEWESFDVLFESALRENVELTFVLKSANEKSAREETVVIGKHMSVGMHTFYFQEQSMMLDEESVVELRMSGNEPSNVEVKLSNFTGIVTVKRQQLLECVAASGSDA
uniref:Ionotropic glutamate receptor C-terminal domain-containing protein n=1 Tax=Timspurckia oligopyrenoides TaxID=708627 RepID=A0A7S1ERI4_9RHOD|mmetsp:Transcript_1753/g.3120  ORF Transcript_1753/g.3120 Transcript_1753/m.3120 type:complete len:700 (+) Transcript_1753:211-2310(+)